MIDYTGYSEWDMQGGRRERIGADCIRAYESSGEEQYQKAAARIAELEAETAVLKKDRDEILAMVAEQADDEGLWFKAQYITEANLQQELRRLHAALDDKP